MSKFSPESMKPLFYHDLLIKDKLADDETYIEIYREDDAYLSEKIVARVFEKDMVRLFVAAPRMLALIKKATDIMDDIAQDCKWLDEANALIAEIEKIK